MSALPKPEPPAELHISESLLEQAGFTNQDELSIRIVGRRRIEVTALAPSRPDPAREFGEQPFASIFRPMSIEELRAQFPIDAGPYDDQAIREAWQAEAGDDIADRIRRGVE